LADDHGLVFVDSPVLGAKLPAEQARLVVFAAGLDTVRTTADPVFDAIGHRTLWLGKEPGTASTLKAGTEPRRRRDLPVPRRDPVTAARAASGRAGPAAAHVRSRRAGRPTPGRPDADVASGSPTRRG
ncbi:MAG: NAD(P)-binding domain-containing protein, partial [Kineosporiaceae bacterium]